MLLYILFITSHLVCAFLSGADTRVTLNSHSRHHQQNATALHQYTRPMHYIRHEQQMSIITRTLHCTQEAFNDLREHMCLQKPQSDRSAFSDINTWHPNWDTRNLIEATPLCPICHIELHAGNHNRLACGHGICCTCWPDFAQRWQRPYTVCDLLTWQNLQYSCPLCSYHVPVNNTPDSNYSLR